MKHPLQIGAMALLITALLSACGGGAPQTPGGGSNPGQGKYTPKPATVQATFHPEVSEATEYTTDGTELSVTAPNGTVYTLEVPANALEAGQPLRLTLASQVSGTPLKSVAGAVRIEPEGMRFYRPATLTITSPVEAATGQVLAGFSFEADGQDFALTGAAQGEAGLAALSGRRSVQVRVEKGRTYGAGYGTREELDAWLGAFSPRDISVMISMVDTFPASEVEAMLIKTFDLTIEPYLVQNNAGALEVLLEAYATWRDRVVERGLADREAFRSRSNLAEFAIKRMATELANKVRENCKAPGGDAAAWEALYTFQFIRYAALKVLDDLKPLYDTIEGCLSFEIRLDSTIDINHYDHNLVVASSAKVSSMVNVTYRMNDALAQGFADLVWNDYRLTPRSDCNILNKTQEAGRFFIANFAPMWTLTEFSPAPKKAERKPRLLYFVGPLPKTSWTVQCRPADSEPHRWDSNSDHWGSPFFMAHRDEGPAGLVEPTRYTRFNKPEGVLAQYIYDRKLSSPGFDSGHEFSVLSIIHRPR
ncbi:hypothetical protein HNR42_001520 [Deinobacterium chartae]|uniref:Uncharacterized protein n=1 Tax=Deinobacterium chartae TaxID=521158 RepID=A0A841I2E5_9DEIO|nr:hypothetical protein [Deinobacterium chartae]MBB6098095.1 hypothetical protein [Deinobacterium chartae]